MWAIPIGTNLGFKKKNQVKSPSIMVSQPELGSDPPIGSGRESGCYTISPDIIPIEIERD